MQRDAPGELLGASPESGFTGQPHRVDAGTRRRRPARGGDMRRLPAKRDGAAKAGGIEHLEKNRGAPPFARIGRPWPPSAPVSASTSSANA